MKAIYLILGMICLLIVGAVSVIVYAGSTVVTTAQTLIEDSVVNGKTLDERLEESYSIIHKTDSADYVKENFPDVVLVYSDYGEHGDYPEKILPFDYYYSEEADKTFSVCAINKLIFVCEGKVDGLITDEQMDSGKCVLYPNFEQNFYGR